MCQDALDGRWERREALAWCHHKYEDIFAKKVLREWPYRYDHTANESVASVYQPCSMAESAARDVTFAVQSGELGKMIRATGSNVSLAGFTVVVPARQDDIPSSVVSYDLETMLCTQILAFPDLRSTDVEDERHLDVETDTFGIQDARLACEAMVIPQLSQESRNYIVGLATELQNFNTTRICLDMVQVSDFLYFEVTFLKTIPLDPTNP